MKRLLLIAALAGLATSAFAQSTKEPTQPSTESAQPSVPASSQEERSAASGASSSDRKTFTHGESKRCESLTGADKDQCDKEEATKTQGPAAQELSRPDEAKKE